MGCCYYFRLNWIITVPVSTIALLVGKVGFLYANCYLFNEDLISIILANLRTSLDFLY